MPQDSNPNDDRVSAFRHRSDVKCGDPPGLIDVLTRYESALSVANLSGNSINPLRMCTFMEEFSRQQKCTESSPKGLPMDWAQHGVKVVHSDQLDINTPQTSGMTRAAAITHASAGASKLWAGTMVVQPDARTGPHHHGELETVLYVVKGRVRMRWGDQLEFSEEARPGDFIYVPPYVPHQEINASPDEICEAVVVRDGQDPIVINLDLRTPEPASAGHPGMPFHPES
jgi:uncharacterized RmlC-like cupin family protein